MPATTPTLDGSVLLLKLSPALRQLIEQKAPSSPPPAKPLWSITPPPAGGSKTFVALALAPKSAALSLLSAAALPPGTLGHVPVLAHVTKASSAMAYLLPEPIELPLVAQAALDEFCATHCPQLGTVLGVIGLIQQSRKFVDLAMRKDPQLYVAMGWEGAKALIDATELVAPAFGFTGVANAACWAGLVIKAMEDGSEGYYAIANSTLYAPPAAGRTRQAGVTPGR